MTLVAHIVAGLLALVSGAVALAAFKGGRLHRRSGTLFVYAMLFMSASGAVMAALRFQRINLIAGVLTFYMVLTAMLTVRRPGVPRSVNAGAMLVGLIAGIVAFGFGFQAASSPTGKIDGMTGAPAFVFGAVALLAVIGDMRMIRAGGIQGPRRIARHLWRMCFGLFVAAGSFFLGQAQVFPKALRHPALLAPPVLAVLVVMAYWLWRVRVTKTFPATIVLPSHSAHAGVEVPRSAVLLSKG